MCVFERWILVVVYVVMVSMVVGLVVMMVLVYIFYLNSPHLPSETLISGWAVRVREPRS